MTFEALRQLGPKVKTLKENELSRHVQSILKDDIGVPFSREVRGYIRRQPSRKAISSNPLRIDFIVYPTEWMYREGIERPIFIELKRYSQDWGKAIAQANDYTRSRFKITQTGKNAITNFAYDHCLTEQERKEGYMYPKCVFVMPDISGRTECDSDEAAIDYTEQYFRHRVELAFSIGSADIMYDCGSLFFTVGLRPIMAIRQNRSCEVFPFGRITGAMRCS